MRTMEINGKSFELTIPRKTVAPFSGWFCDENAIYCEYERPSQTKVSIWKNWLKWARETEGVKAFEITGANCMQFSIGGLYIDESGVEYNMYITREHNRLIKVG